MADEVLAKALGALGRKERTVSEMREWLEARDIEADEIERVVNFLIENEALDDRRFAHLYVSDKRELSGWGNSRIKQTLRKRGLANDLIEDAIAQESEETEQDRAFEVLQQRGADLSDDRGRSRALGLLARRGFSSDDAYAAIRRAESHGRDG